MQKEKQHKKEKKGKKRKNILSIPVHKQENNNRKKKLREKQDKKPIKQVAAFVTLCTTCIGIEEGSRGGGS